MRYKFSKRRQKKNNKEKCKSKRKQKIFRRLNCSPSVGENSYTCYTSKALNKLKDLWNIRHPDDKIEVNNPREIWQILKHKMEGVCDTERCWLNQKFTENDLDKDLKYYTFAPSAPESWKKNPNEWLSSIDLTKVMKQYEKKYPNFSFIGPSPIDFDKKLHYGQCVWNELCTFDIKKFLEKNKTKVGIIFNTDTHDLDGAHWICLLIDLNKKFIYYFDSNNVKVSDEVKNFISRIRDQTKNLGFELEYIENNVKHQQTNTECGMYVLYVIIELLLGKKTPDYFNKRISDSEVEKLRNIYFNN